MSYPTAFRTAINDPTGIVYTSSQSLLEGDRKFGLIIPNPDFIPRKILLLFGIPKKESQFVRIVQKLFLIYFAA